MILPVVPDGAKPPFTAIPRGFVDLAHLNDGEFRTLVLLCMHADAETGECMLKQRTLAAMMGKSTPAISAHVKALRAVGMVETKSQQNTSGANTYLKYRIPFWPKWQAQLRSRKSAKSVQQAERPIQQAECFKKNNQILDNHSPHEPERGISKAPVARRSPQVESVVDKMLGEWAAAIGRGNAYGVFDHPPAPRLVSETKRLLAEHRPPSTDEAAIAPEIQGRLRAVWDDLGVSVTPEVISAQARAITTSTPDPLPFLDRLTQSIRSGWKSFWRRPPTPTQFQDYLKEAQQHVSGVSLATKLRLLAGDLGRYRAAFG